MKMRFTSFVGSLLLLLANAVVAVTPTIPNPVITFIGSETVKAEGKNLTRYNFDVFNKGFVRIGI